MTGVLEPPGERRETSTWRPTRTGQRTLIGRPAAQGLDRYLVHLELATDTFLGLSLLSAGLLGSENLGPTWPWLVVGSLLLATTITLFLRFAFLCWSRSPDPPLPPLPPLPARGEPSSLRLPPLPARGEPSSLRLPPLPARGEPSSLRLPPLPARGEPSSLRLPPLPARGEPSSLRLPPLPASREPSPGPGKWPRSHRGARTITALLAAPWGSSSAIRCCTGRWPASTACLPLCCRRYAGDRQSADAEDHYREPAAGIPGTD